jgi:hypothetical protein
MPLDLRRALLMASEEQIEANRINGRKARGKPRDTSRSRWNRIDHALLAAGITELDHADGYFAHLAQLRLEFQPIGEVENFLVERICLAMTRVRRAVRLEAETITSALHPERRSKSKLDIQAEQSLIEIAGTTSIIQHGFDPQLRSDTVGTLVEVCGRYEGAHMRALYRAIEELQRLQAVRKTLDRKSLHPAAAAIPGASS